MYEYIDKDLDISRISNKKLEEYYHDINNAKEMFRMYYLRLDSISDRIFDEFYNRELKENNN